MDVQVILDFLNEDILWFEASFNERFVMPTPLLNPMILEALKRGMEVSLVVDIETFSPGSFQVETEEENLSDIFWFEDGIFSGGTSKGEGAGNGNGFHHPFRIGGREMFTYKKLVNRASHSQKQYEDP